MLTVYLWDAGAWSGVSGSLEGAQDRAAKRLGEEGHARIEAAWLVVGAQSLVRVYERTGQAWSAYRCPEGIVFWAPTGRVPLRAVS